MGAPPLGFCHLLRWAPLSRSRLFFARPPRPFANAGRGGELRPGTQWACSERGEKRSKRKQDGKAVTSSPKAKAKSRQTCHQSFKDIPFVDAFKFLSSWFCPTQALCLQLRPNKAWQRYRPSSPVPSVFHEICLNILKLGGRLPLFCLFLVPG